MRSHAILPLTLTVSAIALVAVVTTGAAEGSSRHIRKRHQPMNYQQRTGVRFNDAWAPGEVRPAAAPGRTGSACPGNARAIDCTVWPPPFDDDPDRKATSSDGGG